IGARGARLDPEPSRRIDGGLDQPRIELETQIAAGGEIHEDTSMNPNVSSVEAIVLRVAAPDSEEDAGVDRPLEQLPAIPLSRRRRPRPGPPPPRSPSDAGGFGGSYRRLERQDPDSAPASRKRHAGDSRPSRAMLRAIRAVSGRDRTAR